MTGARYFQDPIHGTIAVASPLLQRLIDSRAVQRLKHVRQLGTAFFSFPGAEHSRFSHSLGCMHLMGRVLDHLRENEGLRMSERARENAMIAALLHDAGHCAFSHTLEEALDHKHEAMTLRLVKEEPQLGRILGSRRAQVAAILGGTAAAAGPVRQLISSQLDVDRLDYLVRDAYHTGVDSGRVDLGRIIASLTVHRARLAVKAKAWLALEEYFLARYFMYWKVYFHKTSRGLELILRALVQRARKLHQRGALSRQGLTAALEHMLEGPGKISVADFLDHDDSDLLVAIKAWSRGGDAILADLCGRFLNRRKFKLVWEAQRRDERPAAKRLRRLHAMAERKHPGSGRVYLVEDRFGGRPYDPKKPVMLVTDRGRLVDLASRSGLVREVSRQRVTARWYVPPEDERDAHKILGNS